MHKSAAELVKGSFLLTVMVAAPLVLQGCGGGGGGGAGPSSSLPSTPTISGIAGKGLLLGATVTAYCGNEAPTNIIGTGTTALSSAASPGFYTIGTTASCSLPVKVVVTPGPSAMMIDEIQGTIPVPANFHLSAYIPTIGTAVTQNISPVTDMVAAIVGSSPNAAVVAAAQAAIINNVLGGDASVLNAAPIAPSAYSSSSDPSAKTLFVLLSAVSAAAASGSVMDNGTGRPCADVQCVVTTLNLQATQLFSMASNGIQVARTASAAKSPLATFNAGIAALKSVKVKNVDTAAVISSLLTDATQLQTSGDIAKAAIAIRAGAAGGAAYALPGPTLSQGSRAGWKIDWGKGQATSSTSIIVNDPISGNHQETVETDWNVASTFQALLAEKSPTLLTIDEGPNVGTFTHLRWKNTGNLLIPYDNLYHPVVTAVCSDGHGYWAGFGATGSDAVYMSGSGGAMIMSDSRIFTQIGLAVVSSASVPSIAAPSACGGSSTWYTRYYDRGGSGPGTLTN